ncbi:MAG: acylglycerol kinase family protein, partial [Bacteroidota bacterium]
MKKRICFIVNPFSGIHRNKQLEPKIHQLLDKDRYEYAIKYTNAPGHATELATIAIQEGFDIIVAVGGDGSINEVAQSLIGTDKILGILPAGSGNGLAMHLGLGRNLERAIQ